MIGRFLEFSLDTPDIGASLDFYGRLGFSPLAAGEAWPHPYAVVSDGRICLGLHQDSARAPSLTFVRPDLLKHVAELEQRGHSIEFRRLGNDVFNEIGWRDPSGHWLRLLEARTFSPGKRAPLDTSLCGYFLEIALPAPDRAAATAFWEQLGFVGMRDDDASLPHVACTSDTIDIGLYEPAALRIPTLRFETADLAGALARLAARGIEPGGRVPAALRGGSAALLTAPEGTPLLLVGV